MPYIGFSSFAGDAGSNLDPGAMLGVLLGGRLSPMFSINGEMRVDILNFRSVPSSQNWDASEFDIGVSPLFHVQFPTGNGEFVAGPKLSYSAYQLTLKDSFGTKTYGESWHGWSTGFNAGVFFAVSRVMSIGGMVSYTYRKPTEFCPEDDFGVEHCESVSNSPTGDIPGENVFGFHAALLF